MPTPSFPPALDSASRSTGQYSPSVHIGRKWGDTGRPGPLLASTVWAGLHLTCPLPGNEGCVPSSPSSHSWSCHSLGLLAPCKSHGAPSAPPPHTHSLASLLLPGSLSRAVSSLFQSSLLVQSWSEAWPQPWGSQSLPTHARSSRELTLASSPQRHCTMLLPSSFLIKTSPRESLVLKEE